MTIATFAAPLYVPKFRVLDANANPLAGGKVYTYRAGTSTPQATYPTYDDAIAGTNANANPTILDANGEASIFAQNTHGYKVAVYDADDVLQWTLDNVYAGFGTPSPVVSEWIPETGEIAYISGTSFRVSESEDLTAVYHPGRRVKTINTGGTVYSTVVSSSYGVGTTVTVVNDSGTLDADLSAVFYGITSAVNPSAFDPKSCVSVIKNGDQTDFNGVAKVTPWTEEVDSLAEFATDVFTAKYPGKYLVELSIEFSDSGTDVAVTGYIYKNGSPVTQSVQRSDDTSGEIKSMHLHFLGALAAGDTVEAYVLGSDNTTVKGTSGTRLSVVRIA